VALSGAEPATRHHLRRGLRYALRIFVGVVVLWEISAALGDAAPVWATVSLVMCSEIDVEASFSRSMRRFGHMAIGCAIALAMLRTVGINLGGFAITVALASLAAFFVPEIGGNWRAAGAGTAIVAGARFDTFTRSAALREALVRSAEVLGGCLVALVIAWLATQIVHAAEEIKENTAP
jgi:uncharacterized membrane protein YccC